MISRRVANSADGNQKQDRGHFSRQGAGRDNNGEVNKFLKEILADVLRAERHSVNGSSPSQSYNGARVPDDIIGEMLPEAGMHAPLWKRTLDLSLILLAFPLWLPVITLIALWIGVTSPGPIFYRQARIGYRGRRFMIVKFRTMKVNAETRSHESYLESLMVSDTPMVKLDSRGDPRLIFGGRFLRATGLDELPQLFNVLIGEMSLVGPRPCTVLEFEHFDPSCRVRVAAVPGMTGYWQVNGKNHTTFRRMIELDLFYARNLSLALDLKILLKTLPAVFEQIAEIWQENPPAEMPSVSSSKN